MRRRDFMGSLASGSVALGAIGAFGVPLRTAFAQHAHDQVDGPLASATVSFGQWKTDPPLDRMAGSPPATNSHLLIPYVATIRKGGSVNFVISGLHQVLVYGPGSTIESIDATSTVPSGPGLPPLVNDPVNRIFRGINPATVFPVIDRVEVVRFHNAGTYLVVCGVVPHFADRMHGWVRVLA